MAAEAIGPGDGALYGLLGGRADGELAPLVDLLLSSPTSALGICRAYELQHPAHSLYTDSIADEVYRLAVDALSPKDRRRPGIDAIVAAVGRKVGMAVDQADASRNEALLLDVFAPRDLSTIEPQDRVEVATAMASAAATAVDGMLTGAVWPTLAGCVMHVALLRHWADGSDDATGSVATEPADPTGAVDTSSAGTMVVATEDGIPAMSLSPIADPVALRWRSIASGDPLITALVPILKAVQPFVAADRILANGDFVRVGIKGGAAALSRSKEFGHLVGSAAGHRGQVPFFAVAAGTVAWPAVLAVLVASYLEQKRFENIERGLDEIRRSVEDVSRFQREERRSVLSGSIRYFAQVAQAVLAGELDGEVLQQIERHEADLVRVQDHLAAELETQLLSIEKLKNEGWTSSKFVKALDDQQVAFDRHADDAMLCLRARGCGYQLLSAYPGREALKAARLADIEAGLTALTPRGTIGTRLDRALREKIRPLSFEAKAKSLSRRSAMANLMIANRSDTLHAMMDARRAPDAIEEDVSFAVRIVDGMPTAMAYA